MPVVQIGTFDAGVPLCQAQHGQHVVQCVGQRGVVTPPSWRRHYQPWCTV